MSTALKKFQRLEATALWRETPEAQRKNVIVSLGDATLVIKDGNDRALSHWSLPAVRRLNPGQMPALYFPDGDTGETLEIGADHPEVVEAIDLLRKAVANPSGATGRLRKLIVAGTLTAIAALGIFWLPNALVSHALHVVPDVTRHAIGQQMQAHAQQLTGRACTDPQALPALDALQERLALRRITVVPNALREAVALPGGIVLLGRDTLEDFEEPDVAAGYVIAAQVAVPDPLRDLLENGGIGASFRLLTTGSLPEALLSRHIAARLKNPPQAEADDRLIAAFSQHSVRLKPYAFAEDPSGESTLALIEAAPFTEQPPEPILIDRHWVALQEICGG